MRHIKNLFEQKSVKVALLMAFGTLLLLQFQNCGLAENVTGFSQNSKSVGPGPDDVVPLDLTAPNVTIFSPSDQFTFTSAQTVAVSVAAFDDGGIAQVDIYKDGALAVSRSEAPFEYSYPINESLNGTHQFTARAFDAAGNTKDSTPVTVVVNIPLPDTTPPTVSITTPANNTTYTSVQSISITAIASDDSGVAKVEFYKNGVLVASDSNAPYTYVFNYDVIDNGNHTFMARAFDTVGNTKDSTTVDVFVNISPTGTHPRFSYNADLSNSLPLEGATLNRKVVYIFTQNTESYKRMIYYCCKGLDPENSSEGHQPSVSVTTAPYVMMLDMNNYLSGKRELYFDALYNDGTGNYKGYLLYFYVK